MVASEMSLFSSRFSRPLFHEKFLRLAEPMPRLDPFSTAVKTCARGRTTKRTRLWPNTISGSSDHEERM